jgi:hypothetical protein
VIVRDLTEIMTLTFEAAAIGEASAELLFVGAGGYVEGASANLKIALPADGAATIEIVQGYHPYDFNRDGSVDYGDIAELQKHYGKNAASADWNDIRHMDIVADDDNRIDIADLMQILVYVRTNS